MKNVQNIEPIFITLDRLGDSIDIPIRYSFRAKRIFIKIQHKNAELVLPNKNINAGHKFLLEKESWVRRKLRFSKKYLSKIKPEIYRIV